MRKTKEVLRLRFELGLGQRQIARSYGMGLGTVHQYLERAAAAGIGWPLPEGLSEEELEAKLFGSQAVWKPSCLETNLFGNQPVPARAGRARPQPDWKAFMSNCNSQDRSAAHLRGTAQLQGLLGVLRGSGRDRS